MTSYHLELLIDELNDIAQIELLSPNKKLHQTIILYARYSAACWKSHRKHESEIQECSQSLSRKFQLRCACWCYTDQLLADQGQHFFYTKRATLVKTSGIVIKKLGLIEKNPLVLTTLTQDLVCETNKP